MTLAQYIELSFGDDTCRYYRNDSVDQDFVSRVLKGFSPTSCLIICDEQVERLFAKPIVDELQEVVPTSVLVHVPGEQAKTLAEVSRLCESALGTGIDRGGLVISLGGGLTGNLAGMVASLLFRGVRLVHVPTTFLAMSDSCYSMKQAVNSSKGKNSVGVFKLASAVIVDIEYLEHLPPLDTQSGLFELIKNALAIEPGRIPFLRSHLNSFGTYTRSQLSDLLNLAIESKMLVMDLDPFEKKGALACEYGHTVGHAVEATSGLPHGFSIGMGMLVEAEISHRRGWLSSSEVDTHYDLVFRNCDALPVEALQNSRLVEQMAFDNKRGYISATAGSIPMVLLQSLGRPATNESGIPIVMVAEAEVQQALKATTARLQAEGANRLVYVGNNQGKEEPCLS